MASRKKCPHQTEAPPLIRDGKKIAMFWCAFCADGLAKQYGVSESICCRCIEISPPPNRITDSIQEAIRLNRVGQPDLPNGPDAPYQISVEQAASEIENRQRLHDVVLDSIERGYQTTEEGGRLLKRHCLDSRNVALENVTRRVKGGRFSPKQAAEIAVAAGL